MKRLKVARKAARAKAFQSALSAVNRKHGKILKALAARCQEEGLDKKS